MLRARRVAARGLRRHLAAGADRHASARRTPRTRRVLADSVGLALLVVLDTLTPAERLAFVLHDLFGVPFEEIAAIVDRSPAAARQLASRARRRVRGATPRTRPGLREQRGSSTRSWPPRGTATSRRCSRCSTRTSSSESTPARVAIVCPSSAPRRWPEESLRGLPLRSARAPGNRQRQRRCDRRSRHAAARGRRLHGRERQDRRDRSHREPGEAQPPGRQPGGMRPTEALGVQVRECCGNWLASS